MRRGADDSSTAPMEIDALQQHGDKKCHTSGRFGHLATDCWQNKSKGKDPKGKGGKKGKGKILSYFGSSHFLFECALCFSRSRASLVLSCPSVYNPVLYFLILFHGTCERRNRCASFSGTSLLFEYGFS